MASLGGAIWVLDVSGGVGEETKIGFLGGVNRHLAVEECSHCP